MADHQEPTEDVPADRGLNDYRIFASLEDDWISEVFVNTNECFAQNVQDYRPATEFEKSTFLTFTVAA